MKLIQRLQIALQTFLRDIFDEESVPGASPSGSVPGTASSQEFLADLLNEAQARLDALQVEWTNASARRQRQAHERDEALGQVDRLNEAVDVALRLEQEDLARLKLEQLTALKKRAGELEASQQASAQLVNALQEAIREQQAQLVEVRRKSQDLVERARSADVMEELVRLRREHNRETAAIQAELAGRQEQIARREDRIAARSEIERRSGS